MWHVWWKGRGTYGVVEGKRKGNKPLGRSKHRREDAIKMDLKEIGLEGLDYDLAQGMDK